MHLPLKAQKLMNLSKNYVTQKILLLHSLMATEQADLSLKELKSVVPIDYELRADNGC